MFEDNIPRKLTIEELNLLYRILPERKPGYKKYRELISEYYLSGRSKTGESFYLKKLSSMDTFIPEITPVFASGTFLADNNKITDVTIHEEIDECIEIEVEFKSKENSPDFMEIIYSEWEPGKKAPGDDTFVRQLIIENDHYILAIAPVHKRIWLHDLATGVNHFISTGSYYNSLCIVRNVREKNLVFNPGLLYQKLDTYTDNELISAFHLYNKTLRKFKIEISTEPVTIRKSGFLRRLIKKDKN